MLRINHIGDWGTQFGMLIQYMNQLSTEKNLDWSQVKLTISDLAAHYKSAKKCFDESEAFQEQAKQAVVLLQSGDAKSLELWRYICQVSRDDYLALYQMLGVDPRLQERGESFYNTSLPAVVEELMASGVAVESNGAKCIFLPTDAATVAADKAKKQKTELKTAGSSDDTETDIEEGSVVVIQKSDGGYLYSTTDIAALRQRVTQEQADRIVYVTDAGQAGHFLNLFTIAKRAGSLFPGVLFQTNGAASAGAGSYGSIKSVKLTHVPFGVVTGEDGKRIKSRSGDTVRLRELLEEAIDRAAAELVERSEQRAAASTAVSAPIAASAATRSLSEEELRRKAEIIGIAAIKYADLSFNRETNYRFNFTKMLSMNGNTAPYMLYSYARIQGIKRKVAKELMKNPTAEGFNTDNMLTDLLYSKIAKDSFEFGSSEEETVLLKHILRLDEVMYKAAAEMQPNYVSVVDFE